MNRHLSVVTANQTAHKEQTKVQERAEALAEAALLITGDTVVWQEARPNDFAEARIQFLVGMIAGLQKEMTLPALRRMVAKVAGVVNPTEREWRACLRILRREYAAHKGESA